MDAIETQFEDILGVESIHDFMRAAGRFAKLQAEAEGPRFLLEATMQATRDPTIAGAIREQLAVFRAVIAGRCRQAAVEGLIDSSIDPDGLATALAGLLDGLLLHRLVDPSTDVDAAGAAMLQLLKP